MSKQYEARLYLSDRRKAQEIVRRLSGKLGRNGRIDSVEESDAVGMTRAEIALTVFISFTTSVSANLATPTIQAALNEIRSEAIELLDFEVIPELENKVADQKTPDHSSEDTSESEQ